VKASLIMILCPALVHLPVFCIFCVYFHGFFSSREARQFIKAGTERTLSADTTRGEFLPFPDRAFVPGRVAMIYLFLCGFILV